MGHQQFSQVYKTWSDLELFQLLQNKDDYQEEAVDAAMAEINSRNLSETELDILLKQYDEQQSKKQNTPEKKLARVVETNKEKLIADFNPFSERTIDRHVRLLCYPLAFIILYNFISDYRSIHYMIINGYLNSSTVLSLMPYLFVPIGIYYFWKKQKFGWSIITIWLVLSVVIIVTSCIWELRTAHYKLLDRFFPHHGLSYYLLPLLIFGGLLFYINTKKITGPFNISKKFQFQVGAISVFFALFYMIITLL